MACIVLCGERIVCAARTMCWLCGVMLRAVLIQRDGMQMEGHCIVGSRNHRGITESSWGHGIIVGSRNHRGICAYVCTCVLCVLCVLCVVCAREAGASKGAAPSCALAAAPRRVDIVQRGGRACPVPRLSYTQDRISGGPSQAGTAAAAPRGPHGPGNPRGPQGSGHLLRSIS